jgi:hypothetical protein
MIRNRLSKMAMNKVRSMKIYTFLIMPVLAAVSGCSFFDTSSTSVRSVSPQSALITDSNLKMAYAFADTAKPDHTILCIEPSPDTAANFEKAFEVLTKGGVTITPPVGKTGVNVTSENSGNGENKVTIEKLFDRSQGIQAIRDILFHACVAAANNFIKGDEYLDLVKAALRQNGAVIAAEIAANHGLGDVSGNEQQRLALVDLYKFVASSSVIPRSSSVLVTEALPMATSSAVQLSPSVLVTEALPKATTPK